MVVEVSSGRLKLPSFGQEFNDMPLRCFWDLQRQVQIMMDIFVDAFPINRDEILKQKKEILKMFDEMDHIFKASSSVPSPSLVLCQVTPLVLCLVSTLVMYLVPL